MVTKWYYSLRFIRPLRSFHSACDPSNLMMVMGPLIFHLLFPSFDPSYIVAVQFQLLLKLA